MMEGIWERAREVGRLLAQTEEYKALRRANERVGEDRAAVTALNRLSELEETIGRALQRGDEPGDEEREEYERVALELQALPAYQGIVAAQSNFEKLMMRVNEEVGKGIEAGEQSRLILPT
jgi:cell fate (sporulation/competence/biofilm development) regulator YlbF (YheA/YmcA/DUF963 family)